MTLNKLYILTSIGASLAFMALMGHYFVTGFQALPQWVRVVISFTWLGAMVWYPVLLLWKGRNLNS